MTSNYRKSISFFIWNIIFTKFSNSYVKVWIRFLWQRTLKKKSKCIKFKTKSTHFKNVFKVHYILDQVHNLWIENSECLMISIKTVFNLVSSACLSSITYLMNFWIVFGSIFYDYFWQFIYSLIPYFCKVLRIYISNGTDKCRYIEKKHDFFTLSNSLLWLAQS